ncbi:MAG TPA: sodium ion-translocating decarboxylase subunit beta [Candidatus Ornithomonoglobus intestinigallinarum]|uniref:Sodium ion-translocating decarboxylase subunit beta n=1 Tax=Candidatus Ornithomonoglobus intestinigallinarum TaxID=2840894 RepID=A0A9D1KQD1_9FIRM|nr:sodium ion-translocating decarboxylase subunit beta [Candidatus Ornithomonoglobus intestinigallinarum]
MLQNAQETLASGGNFLQVAGTPIMLAIACVLLYLAIVKKFEPLLLLPIAFGMLLSNLPMLKDSSAIMMHTEFFTDPNYMIDGQVDIQRVVSSGGLLDLLYLGVKLGIYPPLIFVGIGCMTDFGPLIANPKSILLGAAAQFGVFFTFLGALVLSALIPSIHFGVKEASSIGIIGGADGPTAIYVTKSLAPALLPAIAIAAYSYMALIPVIQPPIMKLMTTKKMRGVVMEQLRPVSKTEKILFPIIVTIVVGLIIPDAVSLVGCLMLGNILKESGVVDRLSKTAQNELMNIITIFLGITVGATATAESFLNTQTLGIIALGLIAFAFSTVGGLFLGDIMYWVTKGKVNPLIGSAGVSAVPMAARVSQVVGQKENPSNFLLMHAMGPNVAGVIGSAVAAGVFLSMFTNI